VLARARAGDESAFADLVHPHERALFRHCYRMFGSGHDAEDAVQDTLVRAWRRLDSYDARGAFGGWLYRIATNVCLDRLRTRRRQSAVVDGPGQPAGSDDEPVWIEPVDDVRLGASTDPEAEVLRREDVSLAFLAALQRLAPRHRACLLLHDVLGFSQAEVSEALDMSATAVNSTLYRARLAVRPRPDDHLVEPSNPRLNELLARYVRAWELTDINSLVQLVADDVRFAMPPMPDVFTGRSRVAAFVEGVIFSGARPHGVPLRAGWCNGQPAFATYAPDSQGRLVVTGLQVLTVVAAGDTLVISEITSFRDSALAARCGLPDVIDAP
jgi:RNA polymerase sigma-70 factor (TIGR02960 family)